MKFYRLYVFIILCFLSNNVFAQIMNDTNTKDETDLNLIRGEKYILVNDSLCCNDKKYFFFAGATIGTPGAVSVNAGYYFNHFAVKLSGSYLKKDWYGVQSDIEFVLNNTGELIQGISLTGGLFDAIHFNDSGVIISQVQQNYIGFAYDAYYAGFYLQTGLGFGFRSYPPNPQLLFQFGYLFRL
ncbi:MAG: hypothetical protein ACYDA4_06630 [Ignavibacteriaceae bacterium]